MAKNTGEGYRKGAISERSQVFNPKNNQYIKRDTTTGHFVSSKNTPYKSIKVETKKDKKIITTKQQKESST